MEEVRECVGGGATSSLPAGGRVGKTITTPSTWHRCKRAHRTHGAHAYTRRTRRTRIHTAHTHTHGARTKSHIIVIAY